MYAKTRQIRYLHASLHGARSVLNLRELKEVIEIEAKSKEQHHFDYGAAQLINQSKNLRLRQINKNFPGIENISIKNKNQPFRIYRNLKAYLPSNRFTRS